MKSNKSGHDSFTALRLRINPLTNLIAESGKSLTTSTPKTPPTLEKAKEKIWHTWILYKTKVSLNHDAYFSYLSILANFKNQQALSSIMFGRHHAEIAALSKDRIANPYITNQAHYHRTDFVNSQLLSNLTDAFNLSYYLYEKKEKHIIPLNALRTVPIESLLNAQCLSNISVIRKPDCPVLLLLVNQEKDEILPYLSRAGLTATAWNIATHLFDYNTYIFSSLKPNHYPYVFYEQFNRKKDLIASNLFNKLILTAKNQAYPTHLLAEGLTQLIQDDALFMPSDSLKRIALFLDMANTFYRYNYPRYAFCVYGVVHEISIVFAQKNQPAATEKMFDRFLIGSKKTLLDALELNQQDMSHAMFFACPALSGTHAFMIAKRIAMQMNGGATPPTIVTHRPVYHELEVDEFATSWISAPDIHVISCGPMLKNEGIWPGVNLNDFILKKTRRQFPAKPITIIVDITTALYKNLKLSPQVKQLIQTKYLSLIFFESGQKFGLLHTDQVQYGRVFGLCSTQSYSRTFLAQLMSDTKFDFTQHIDMQIGAYIGTCCQSILEKIKQRHFHNSNLFSIILDGTPLLSKKINSHPYMLTQVDELCFLSLNQWNLFNKIIELRDSFGHYNTTLTYWGDDDGIFRCRLSSNASDDMDTIMTAAQIYLSHVYPPETLPYMLSAKSNELCVTSATSDKILVMALALNVIKLVNQYQLSFLELINTRQAMASIIRSCHADKNRKTYHEIMRALSVLTHLVQKIFLRETNIAMAPKFLNAMHANRHYRQWCVQMSHLQKQVIERLNQRGYAWVCQAVSACFPACLESMTFEVNQFFLIHHQNDKHDFDSLIVSCLSHAEAMLNQPNQAQNRLSFFKPTPKITPDVIDEIKSTMVELFECCRPQMTTGTNRFAKSFPT